MIASVRGKAQGDRLSRRRAPIRIATALLAAAAFAIGATSAMATTTTTTTVIDPGTSQPATTVDTTPVVDPALADTTSSSTVALDPAPAPTPDPTTVVADPVAPVPPAPVDPVAPTTAPATTTTTTPAAPAEPAPDQLSPVLLAQVNGTAADAAVPPNAAADIPPVSNPTRTAADAPNLAAKPAPPPPTGDAPPGALVGARKGISRLAALVPSLVPFSPTSADRGVATPPREATATRASPVWNQFIWRDVGAGGNSPNLGTRALLAMIGILPFAPVDGPDHVTPPSSQLALLIPVLGLVAFLFATRPIFEPRRRAPRLYRAVALRPG